MGYAGEERNPFEKGLSLFPRAPISLPKTFIGEVLREERKDGRAHMNVAGQRLGHVGPSFSTLTAEMLPGQP